MTLFLGRTPIFWFPYIYQSLNDQFSYNLDPGYNSTWGAYLLTSITFPIATNVSGTVHLDLRTSRGPALGGDAHYHLGDNNESYGHLRLYGMFDQSPNINETALGRAPISAGRYRILYQSRTYITEDLSAVVDFNKLSDQYFLQDFYPAVFAYDPQPDTYFELLKRGEAYTLNVHDSCSSEQLSGNGRTTCPNLAGRSREHPCLMDRFSTRQRPAHHGCTVPSLQKLATNRSICRLER